MIAEDVTYWARNGDVNIAYKIVGGGPMDLVFLTGLVSHIEVILEEPGLRRWFERLGRIARVILVDRRGSGLSDPLTGPLSLDEEIEDVVAVLDAVGTDRAVLQAYASGGPLAIAFACAHPERTLALVLYASMVRTLQDVEGGYHWADTREVRDERIDALVQGLGERRQRGAHGTVGRRRPGAAAWLARLERLSMTPAGVRRLAENLADVDVRHAPGEPPRAHAGPPPHRRPAHRRAPLALPRRAHPGRALRRAARATTACRWSATPRRCSARSRSSSPAARASGRTASCSTVLFTDVVDATGGRPGWATGAGATCSPPTTTWSARELGALRRPRGQDDRRRLPRDVRRPAVPGRALRAGDRRGGDARSASRSAAGCTRGSASCSATTSGAWRSTSPRACARWPRPARSSPRGRSTDRGRLGAGVGGPGDAAAARRPRPLAAVRARLAPRSATRRRATSPARRNLRDGKGLQGAGARPGGTAPPPVHGGFPFPPRLARRPIRMRKSFSSLNVKWLLAASVLLALVISPFAVAAPPATEARSRVAPATRAPTSRRRSPARRRSSPTTSTYGTRQSNKSANGGGAIYGCRAKTGAGNKPCVRASNLADGLAFQFATDGPLTGTIDASAATTPSRSPRTRRASPPG